jgi:hypothetical protein
MDVAQGLQQFRTLYGDLHCEIHEESQDADNKGGAAGGFRQAQPSPAAGFSMAFHRGVPEGTPWLKLHLEASVLKLQS